jgi:hypothetical protein
MSFIIVFSGRATVALHAKSHIQPIHSLACLRLLILERRREMGFIGVRSSVHSLPCQFRICTWDLFWGLSPCSIH